MEASEEQGGWALTRGYRKVVAFIAAANPEETHETRTVKGSQDPYTIQLINQCVAYQQGLTEGRRE